MIKVILSRWVLGSAFLSLGLSLQAGIIKVGDPAVSQTGNCDPFGCPEFFGLGTYQQVYAAKAFSGETTIEGLTFYDEQVNIPGQIPAGGTYTLSFSYTFSAPDKLNLASASDNVSLGSKLFFSGSLPAITDHTLDFVGRTPFVYNPADGNLLLTVQVTNPSDPANQARWLNLDQASETTMTTNAYFGLFDGQPVSGGNGPNSGGLVTGFTVGSSSVTTPEPGSLLVVLAGVAGLIGYGRRRRGLL